MFQDILTSIQTFMNQMNLGYVLTTVVGDTLDVDIYTIINSNFYQVGCDLFGMMALALTTLYLVIYIVNSLIDGKMTREIVFRAIIRFAAVYFLIKYGAVIIAEILDFGNNILAGITQSFSFENSSNSYASNDLISGVFAALVFIVTLLPNMGIVLLTMILVKIVLFQRYIELSIYTIGFPLAMANFMQNGLQSSSITYIKRFLGLALQGVVIMIIVQCCGVLFNNSLTDDLFLSTGGIMVVLMGYGTMASIIVMSIASFVRDAAVFLMLASMLLRSKQITFDILGIK